MVDYGVCAEHPARCHAEADCDHDTTHCVY